MPRALAQPCLSGLLLTAALAGCAEAAVVVEVLPPRTSVTCVAPDKSAAALGRGLLDVTASIGTHGAYTADVRLSAKGQDARVEGFTLEYVLPGSVDAATAAAASSAGGDLIVGDVALFGEDDDVRTALVENVQLFPRALSVAIEEDTTLAIDKIEFATVGVTLTPIVGGADSGVVGEPSTFSLDVCKGCLVLPPDACAGEGEFKLVPVTCRPGQDTPLFTCVSAP
jgi:hypothetical protein